MIEAIIFILGTVGIVWISIPSLRQAGSHGFYRFFAWEIILGMFVINMRGWFADPLAWNQIISWVLLIAALIPIVYGVVMLRKVGKPTDELEATTKLVTTGIYKLIRHPLYASLLYLAWGIFFKSPSLLDGCLAVVATAFLTRPPVRMSVSVCLSLGRIIKTYMGRTKRFIPFVY